MFWGTVLKQGVNYKLADSQVDVVHISNVALGAGGDGKTTVYAKVGGEEFVLVNLERSKLEQTPLDLYFRVDQKVEFGVKGKGEVHLSGYVEPEVDEDDLSEDEEEDVEAEDSEEEEEEVEEEEV